MLSFDFAWIFLLLPLPWLVYRFAKPANRQQSALLIPFYSALPTMNSQSVRDTSLWRIVLLSLCWVLLLGAAARPLWIGDQIQLPSNGRNLMLAVDISGSMQIEDMTLNNKRANRLQVVKRVVGEFVQQRGGDRLGLILFGSQAYLQTPLTFDRHTLHSLLLEAQIGFAGEKTAIGDAIGLAIKRLRDNKDASRVLILLTDGANTDGQVPPKQAADLAKQAGVKIYTIGMGAEEMISGGILGTSIGARRRNPSADLDEGTLQYIADKTDGRYFRARNSAELANIYQELDALEAIEQDAEFFRPKKSLAHYLLAAVIGLLFVGFLLARIGRLSATNTIGQKFKPLNQATRQNAPTPKSTQP